MLINFLRGNFNVNFKPQIIKKFTNYYFLKWSKSRRGYPALLLILRRKIPQWSLSVSIPNLGTSGFLLWQTKAFLAAGFWALWAYSQRVRSLKCSPDSEIWFVVSRQRSADPKCRGSLGLPAGRGFLLCLFNRNFAPACHVQGLPYRHQTFLSVQLLYMKRSRTS